MHKLHLNQTVLFHIFNFIQREKKYVFTDKLKLYYMVSASKSISCNFSHTLSVMQLTKIKKKTFPDTFHGDYD